MGAAAALFTAFCWAFTSLFFAAAGKQVGSVTVNRMRLLLVIIPLSITHLISQGRLLPLDAEPHRWLWLGLSGIVGLVLGDALLFQAFVQIGARLSMLMMACVPVISTLFAWIFLGEKLSPIEISGIALTVTGISIVVLERGNGGPTQTDRRKYLIGVLYGLGGAFGQAVGLVLAKQGLEGNYPALSGVMIRMIVAVAVLWTTALVTRQAGPTLNKVIQNPKVLRPILSGTIVGPYLGVWASLVAVQLTFVGIASTLMATTPIIMLPLARWLYKENISPRAIAGTLLSVAGVSILFLLSA
jgi:drug/metabolite transporter (DMT)-like permease